MAPSRGPPRRHRALADAEPLVRYVCDVLLRVVRHAAMVYKSTRGDHDELFDIISSPRDPDMSTRTEQLCDRGARGRGREVSSSHDVVRDRAGTEDWLSKGPEYVVRRATRDVRRGDARSHDGARAGKDGTKDGRSPRIASSSPRIASTRRRRRCCKRRDWDTARFPRGRTRSPDWRIARRWRTSLA